MNITFTTDRNIDVAGYLEGKPVEVFLPPAQGASITLSFGKMSTSEMVDSKLFQTLEKAGFEVNRDWRDFHKKSRGGILDD